MPVPVVVISAANVSRLTPSGAAIQRPQGWFFFQGHEQTEREYPADIAGADDEPSRLFRSQLRDW